jgi:ribonuclease VapC
MRAIWRADFDRSLCPVGELEHEPERRGFIEAIESADLARMSVASLGRPRLSSTRDTERKDCLIWPDFISRASIEPVPVDQEQGKLVRSAFTRSGICRHRAGLNFGDCFSYAAAISLRETWLFKGDDFAYRDAPSSKFGMPDAPKSRSSSFQVQPHTAPERRADVHQRIEREARDPATEEIIDPRLSDAAVARGLGLCPCPLMYDSCDLLHQFGSRSQIRRLLGLVCNSIPHTRVAFDFAHLLPPGTCASRFFRYTNFPSRSGLRFLLKCI